MKIYRCPECGYSFKRHDAVALRLFEPCPSCSQYAKREQLMERFDENAFFDLLAACEALVRGEDQSIEQGVAAISKARGR